jgi:hypothetical protein
MSFLALSLRLMQLVALETLSVVTRCACCAHNNDMAAGMLNGRIPACQSDVASKQHVS